MAGPTKAHFGTNIVFQAQCVEPHWLVLLYAKTRQTSLIFCGAFSLFAQNREGARRSQSTSSAALVHVHKNCRKNVAQIDGKQNVAGCDQSYIS